MATESRSPSTARVGSDSLSGSLKLPSAGSIFGSCRRPESAFLESIRWDLETPVHAASEPNGFDNPSALCYRNAVLIALLNTDRALSYLFVQMHQLRGRPTHQTASQHLVVRLYNLALAYWDPEGLHPRDRTVCFERMCTLLWRSCKYFADSVVGGKTWSIQCDSQVDEHPSAQPLYQRQQDAVDFFQWIVETMCNQMFSLETMINEANPHRPRALFHIRTTKRLVCHKCKYPARRRVHMVEEQVGLKVYVAATPDAANRHVPLATYLEAYFNERPNAKAQCRTCKASDVNIWHLHRLQSTPEILAVHLSRGLINKDGRSRKSFAVVDIPQHLDVTCWLEPHVFADKSRVVYRLTAVVSHQGRGLQSGHYTAFVRSENNYRPWSNQGHEKQPEDAAWLQVNDRRVLRGINLGKISNTAASFSSRHEHGDWSDPVLLLYEKWDEKYTSDPETNQQLFQAPMNKGIVKDQQLEDAMPPVYHYEPPWEN